MGGGRWGSLALSDGGREVGQLSTQRWGRCWNSLANIEGKGGCFIPEDLWERSSSKEGVTVLYSTQGREGRLGGKRKEGGPCMHICVFLTYWWLCFSRVYGEDVLVMMALFDEVFFVESTLVAMFWRWFFCWMRISSYVWRWFFVEVILVALYDDGFFCWRHIVGYVWRCSFAAGILVTMSDDGFFKGRLVAMFDVGWAVEDMLAASSTMVFSLRIYLWLCLTMIYRLLKTY